MTVRLTLPNNDQRISHIWKTTIQENIEGDEKRSAVLTWPRINIDNSIKLVTDEERRYISTQLFREIHNLWGIPIIPDEALLTIQASAAQAVLTVDNTDYKHFYVGRQCILVDATNWDTYEVVTILSIDSSTQITLNSNLSNNWAIGTKFYPLYDCRIASQQTLDIPYTTYNVLKLITKESLETAHTFTYVLPTIDTNVFPEYNGSNVFIIPPSFPLKEEYRHDYTTTGDIGLITSFSVFGDTRELFSRDFYRTSAKDIHDLFDFFDAKQGRLGTFYVPTWKEDIVFSSGFVSTDTVLNTKELYLTETELVGRHIIVFFTDGSYTCKEITDKSDSYSITIGSAIGTTVTTSNILDVLCSFLPLARFDVDEISFQYFTKIAAKTKLRFNTL